MQAACSFGRKTRRLPDDVVPRGELDPRGRREERVTGTGTGEGTGTRTRMATGTKAGIGDENGSRNEHEMERKVEGRENPETYEVILELGRKTRKKVTPTSNQCCHSRKTRRPSETVVSFGGPEPSAGWRETGPGRTEERQRGARNLRIVIDAMWKRLGRYEKKPQTREC